MYYYRGDQMGAGGWFFMALVGVLIVGLITALVVWLMRDQRRRSYTGHHRSDATATEILDRRLATGEIGIQEYDRLRSSITGAVGGAAAGPPSIP